MTALERPDFLSIPDYLAGEEGAAVKHEYLGGSVHAMAGGSNRHNTISLNALGAFLAGTRGKTCQPFNSDTKVRIEFSDHTRFYYPDAMVVCQPNAPEDHFQERPVLILEVLSESTKRTDMGEKRDAYLSIPTLKVLLLAESESSAVTVYRRKPEGGFATEYHSGPGVSVPLPELDISLALTDLYHRADLPA